ncbi:hypothetical protein NLG97_g2869 [Lecanicillium saksenae]|uniref:Uncharacterized protein n=1 Tax=Lecanicillium saksenae TaxID=468837 RepID=A0ACC1QZM7_9HYPO|nr:hypothetical protein NLG97_g2869 [Lecanicillium saksenae]
MKFTTGLLALASVAAAAPAGEESPLDVKLEMSGNSAVKAVITNVGKENLKLLRTGSILDKIATQKATVSIDDNTVKFEGVRGRINFAGIQEDAFQSIEAGKSIDVTFDIAETHDLSAGGKYKIASSGSIKFQSNQIDADVNGTVAEALRSTLQRERRAKRSVIASDCTGAKLRSIKTALANCKALAQAGKTATSSSAKMKEFFGSDSQATVDKVNAVFAAASTECGGTSSGADLYCTDIYNECGGYLALTYPSKSEMVYCPEHFKLPATTSTCYGQSQDNTVLHESTHLSYVGNTDDHAYGYDDIVKLTTKQALDNADTYAIFAQAASSGC